MCPADAGDGALVAQQRVELPALALEDLGERRRVELERVGPEVARDRPRSASGVTSHTPARFFLPASVSTSSAPPSKRSAEHRRLRLLRARREEAQPPGAHQVDAQDEVVAVDGEEEVLAAPLGALQPPAVERRQRRVERLQRGDVRGAGLLDRRRGDERIELPHPRLDLR